MVDRLAADRTAAPFSTKALLDADPKLPGPPPAGELTLDRAVGLTLAHNLSLVASAQNVRLAQAALAQAGLLQNPTLGQSNGILFPIAPVMGRTPYDFNLSQELNGLFTRDARIDAAKLQRFQAGVDLASQAFDLAEQVVAKYQELSDDAHSAALARRTAELYDRSLRAARGAGHAGHGPGVGREPGVAPVGRRPPAGPAPGGPVPAGGPGAELADGVRVPAGVAPAGRCR